MGAALICLRPQFHCRPPRPAGSGASAFLGRHGRPAGVRRHVGPLGPSCDLRRQPAVLRRVLDRFGIRQTRAATVHRALPGRRRRRHGHPDQRRLPRRDRPAPPPRHHRGFVAQPHLDLRRDGLQPDRLAADGLDRGRCLALDVRPRGGAGGTGSAGCAEPAGIAALAAVAWPHRRTRRQALHTFRHRSGCGNAVAPQHTRRLLWRVVPAAVPRRACCWSH